MDNVLILSHTTGGMYVTSVESSEAVQTAESTYYPELVLCLCAAVGTDTTVVSEALASGVWPMLAPSAWPSPPPIAQVHSSKRFLRNFVFLITLFML